MCNLVKYGGTSTCLPAGADNESATRPFYKAFRVNKYLNSVFHNDRLSRKRVSEKEVETNFFSSHDLKVEINIK